MRAAVIPPEIEDAEQAWFRGEASIEQMELIAVNLMPILDLAGERLSDGEFWHHLSTIAGVRKDLSKIHAVQRLHSEGIQE